MKDTFEEFVALMKVNRKNCPWSNEKSMEEYCTELESEIKEVKEALAKKDYANLKEELGDVFLDFVMLIIIAEEQGICTLKECMAIGMEKIKRRKPYLLKDEKITKEEAMKIWKEIKLYEKNNRGNKTAVQEKG